MASEVPGLQPAGTCAPGPERWPAASPSPELLRFIRRRPQVAGVRHVVSLSYLNVLADVARGCGSKSLASNFF